MHCCTECIDAGMGTLVLIVTPTCRECSEITRRIVLIWPQDNGCGAMNAPTVVLRQGLIYQPDANDQRTHMTLYIRAAFAALCVAVACTAISQRTEPSQATIKPPSSRQQPASVTKVDDKGREFVETPRSVFP